MYVWRKSFLLAVAMLIIGSSYSAYALLRPLPVLQPQIVSIPNLPASDTNLTWPTTGQSAVGAVGYGVLENHGPQNPAPTASVAKVLTALVILDKKPLALGEQGPDLIITDADVALYTKYAANDGSVVRVMAGEHLSEYQALQALLLPSANNIADSLAIWAFGSINDYNAYANNYARKLEMTMTHITDPSGYLPSTTSTASDLVKLGEKAMENPVVSEIVGQSQADIPVAGTIKNVNILLGQKGIIGLKTGNTDQAGGVFLLAAKSIVGNKPLTIVTAVVGSPTLYQAMRNSLPLLASVNSGFSEQTVVHRGDTIARFSTPWGGKLTAVADKDVSVLSWKGTTTTFNSTVVPLNVKSKVGVKVGRISSRNLNVEDSYAVVKQAPSQPTMWWRLTHPR